MPRVPKSVQSAQKCQKCPERPKVPIMVRKCPKLPNSQKVYLKFFLGHPVHVKLISQGEPLKKSDWGWLSLNFIRYKALPALSQSLFHISAICPTDFRI